MSACKAILAAPEDATYGNWLEGGVDDFGRPVSASTMSKALSLIGCSIGPTTLKDHRREACCCFRNERTPE